jgi:SAM-dependent methyltransferase
VLGIRGDAESLPFPDAALDAVAYHFVLLWVRDPTRALREARRVLKPGGVVMILAEPDLTARIDEPDSGLGRAIVQSVRHGGGTPEAGARVGRWMEAEGFRPRISATTAEWAALTSPAEAEHELAFLGERAGLTEGELSKMAELERTSAEAGTRRVFLPLYYGVGLKPD